MTEYIKSRKHFKLIAFLSVIVICLALVTGFSLLNAFAKTSSSDGVKTVFFYATDTNGQDVYVSSATIDELAKSSVCHGNTETGTNYYASLLDSMPAVTYTEGQGITLDDFVDYMTEKSEFADAKNITFNETNNSSDSFGIRPTDKIDSYSTHYTYSNCFTDRYYYPAIYDYYEGGYSLPEDKIADIKASGIKMPVYLAVESNSGRVSDLSTEIAANSGEVTGCLADSLNTENSLRLVMPLKESELYDDEDGSFTATAGKSTKWIYQTHVKYKNNTDSPITALGTVAAPTCKLVLDGTTLKITFDCETEGVEIYHSLEVDGDNVNASKVPQNKYDGNTIEIKNYDTENPITIYYRAVKAGYSDADVQTISSNDYELAGDPDEPNFSYVLDTSETDYKVNKDINLTAQLTSDEDCKVYGLEYQIKVPTEYFAVKNVNVADNWKYGSAVVDDNTVLTFICLDTSGIDMTADTPIKFADITLNPLAAGNTAIGIGDKTVTKEDSSVYANISGSGIDLTIESTGGETVSDSWDGTYDISWYNRTANEFHITTPEQLAGLAYIVNQGTEFKLDGETSPEQECFTGKTIYLDNDIYLNDHQVSGEDSTAKDWTSIAGGEATENNGAVFDGIFDGQNHKIYNLYIYDTSNYSEYSGRNRGLFGVTSEAAEIKNVTIENGYIRATRGVGAVVGKTGVLSSDGKYDASRTGHGTLITNCHNVNTTVISSESKGVGGICGSAWNYAIISQCSNSGAISSTSKYPAGGIAGENEYIIKDCYNSGSISSASNNAGGIVGSNKSTTSEISSCYNTGNVSGANAGGIAGYQAGVSGNCYNIGVISGTNAGAIFGQQKSDLENNNNYYLNTADKGIGNLSLGNDNTVSKTADELQDLAETLGASYKADTANINNGYPVLTWQTGGSQVEKTYLLKAVSSKESVDKGSSFSIDIIVDSETADTFGGAQCLISYDSSLVAYDGPANVADGFVCSDKNNGLMIVGFGAEKAIGDSGYRLITLKFHALSDLPAGDQKALFTLTNAMVAVNGQIVGQEAETVGETVTIKNTSGGGNIGGGTVVTTEYTVSFMDGDTVLSKQKVEDGAKVTKPNDPTKESYVFTGWYSDKECTKVYDFDSKITADTKIYAGWNKVTSSFTDIEGHWAKGAIEYVVDKGLFKGTTNTLFSPNENMSRAMLVTVLWRMDGETSVSEDNLFTDIVKGAYYEDAVNWAVKNNIVKGYSDQTFGPNDNITREQTAAILYRYAEFKGYDVTKSADIKVYADYNKISAYAVESLRWANGTGLITGRTETTLVPQGTATRAEVAAILQRFAENIK
jgi:uncharacterized repeat protein (TIGR02543 family)